jgi:uncharacterized protein YhdP
MQKNIEKVGLFIKSLLAFKKILKNSSLVAGFLIVFLVLLFEFLTFFPAALHTSLEQQLSKITQQNVQISGLGFGIKNGNIVVKINSITLQDLQTRALIMRASKMYWRVKLPNLFADIYHPSQVALETLEVFIPKNSASSSLNIDTIFSQDMLDYISSFRVERLLLKGAYSLEVASFKTTLLGDLLRIDGRIDYVDMQNLSRFLPPNIVSEATYDWLEKAFIAGEASGVEFSLDKNLSQQDFLFKVGVNVKKAQLFFAPNWQPLKDIDAKVIIENTKITIKPTAGSLYNLPLQGVHVFIQDMSADDAKVQVVGRVDAPAKTLMTFLKSAPLDASMQTALESLELNGEVVAQVDLAFPLNDDEAQIQVEAKIKNATLNAFDGALMVEDYTTSLVLNQTDFSAFGTGDIRGDTFEIGINPNHEKTFALSLKDVKNALEIYIQQGEDDFWHGSLDSPKIKSQVQLDLSNNAIKVVLQDLHINTKIETPIELDLASKDIPSMFIRSEGVILNNNPLPDFQVDLVADSEVVFLKNLVFDTQDLDKKNLEFNGSWAKNVTSLNVKVKGKKLSKFLKTLGIKEKVKGGKFEAEAKLYCDCAPWKMTANNLSGQIDASIKTGAFTEQGLGLGRVLLWINLTSIAKRLQVDDNDLGSEGLVYDSIDASVVFQQGIVEIQEFSLLSPISKIYLKGSSSLIDETYHLTATVTPEIGDSVPIATYLAGGGVTGLGVWLLDKILFKGKIVDTIFDNTLSFDYKITGPWKQPIIK